MQLHGTSNHRVLSVGYEALDLADFLDELVGAGVGVLFDVRLNALSRKPGFSKRRLTEALLARNIRYVHLRVLGNPRENRDGYAQPTSERGRLVRKSFEQRLQEPEAQSAVEAIRSASKQETVAILCFERDHSLCHRSQIVAALVDD